MCINPITIKRNLKDYNKPSEKARTLFRYNIRPFATDTITVPCGHCAECLKKRQLDLSVRCMREAERFGSMVFVTLTYRDSELPISVTLEQIDKETGDIIAQPPQLLDRRSPVRSLVLDELLKIRPGVFARRFTMPFEEANLLDEKWYYQYVFTPSISRLDVRLWLKKARVAYEREFGSVLPEFKYCCVGEYGPKTCRPHAHLAFFGLSKKQVDYLCSKWQYGFTQCKQVMAVNKDGSSGFVAASRYIGKYMSKGKFECDSVKDKISIKPRLMLSIHFGDELGKPLLSYYRAYDLYGEYDIDTLRFTATNRPLSVEQLNGLRDEVFKRASISIAGNKFPIPQVLFKKIWYVPSEKSPGSFRSSSIRGYFSSFVDNEPLRGFIETLRQTYTDIDAHAEDISTAIHNYLAAQEESRALESAFKEQSISAFYKQSKF